MLVDTLVRPGMVDVGLILPGLLGRHGTAHLVDVLLAGALGHLDVQLQQLTPNPLCFPGRVRLPRVLMRFTISSAKGWRPPFPLPFDLCLYTRRNRPRCQRSNVSGWTIIRAVPTARKSLLLSGRVHWRRRCLAPRQSDWIQPWMEEKSVTAMACFRASVWSRFYHRNAFPVESGTYELNSGQCANNSRELLGPEAQ